MKTLKVYSLHIQSLFFPEGKESFIMEMRRKKSRLSTHDKIMRLVVQAILLAIGVVLMMLGKVQPYPLASFLQLEVSDSIVLVAYSLYGFGSSLFVAIGKCLLVMLIFGPTGSPIPVGNITAIITSICYSFALLVLDKGLNIFSKKAYKRYIGYGIIILFVTFILTLLNYLFITPTFMTYGAQFLTFVDMKEALKDSTSSLGSTFIQYFGESGYEIAICLLYIPFNLLKGALVCLTYELIFNRVIFHLLKTGKYQSKIFMKKEEIDALENEKESHSSLNDINDIK